MLLDTMSDLADLTRWKGRCAQIYSYVCRYCSIVHLEGEGYTAAARIGQREANRQVRQAGWSRKRGAWYCPSCRGMDRFVTEADTEVSFVPLVGDWRQRDLGN